MLSLFRNKNKELTKAVANNNFEKVKKLVKSGASVNYIYAEEYYSCSILIYAIRHSTTKIVKFLIENGADVNLHDNSGKTALTYAVELSVEESIEKVQILVEAGANVNHENSSGRTVLMNASVYGNYKCVEYLILHGANVNSQNNEGLTALVYAKNFYTAKLLVESGADVNIKSNRGFIALISRFLQLDYGHAPNSSRIELEILELLIDSGSDLDNCNMNGTSALMYASIYGSLILIKKIISYYTGDLEKYLYKENTGGYNSAILASFHGHKNILIYLLSIGYNPNKVTIKYFTIYNKGVLSIKNYLDSSKYRNKLLRSSPERIKEDIMYAMMINRLHKDKQTTTAIGLDHFNKYHRNEIL